MERSKFESLQRTIEEQNKKIETYKSKLKDVVQAYKDLSREKEALEVTVTALKSIQPNLPNTNNTDGVNVSNDVTKNSEEIASDAGPDDKTDNSDNDNEDGKDSRNLTNPQKVESSNDSGLSQQIDVLTSSLLTITQQKSKLEANFIAERKHFKQMFDDKEKEINNLLEQIQQLEGTNNEWRIKLRQQQQEHDKQQNDCSLMIKELQTIINTQKIEIMRFESQVEDLKLTSEEKQKSSVAYLNVMENKEKMLKTEIEEMKVMLKEASLKLNEPTPQVAILEQKLAEAEERELKQRKMDEIKIEELEMKIKEICKFNESRVANLEENVRQLSASLGTVEKERRNDQLVIEKLKDRNLQLDQENIALLNISKAVPKVVDDEDTASTDELIAKNINQIADMLSSDQDLHLKCKQQHEQLQEEFERYKLRAQSVLKNKSKESNTDQELITLKRQISELKEKQSKLIAAIDTKEKELSKKEETQMSIINSLEEKHKIEIIKIHADNQQKVSDLELEMRKQRDRTISMLADKDQEINELKIRISSLGKGKNTDKDANLISYCESPYANKITNVFESFTSQLTDNSEVGASSASNEESADFTSTLAIKELLSRSPFLTGNESVTNLLHFAQEKSKLEIEISNLRKQKHDVEQNARETYRTLTLEKQECEKKLLDMIEFVKKMERDSNRENANMEYLKNVVYQYIICKDGLSRWKMFNAISTILQFSPAEKQVVLSKKGWSLYQHNPISP